MPSKECIMNEVSTVSPTSTGSSTHCIPRCCRLCCHESRNFKNLEWNLQRRARLGKGAAYFIQQQSISQYFAFYVFVPGGWQVQVLCCDVRLVQQAFRNLSHLIQRNFSDH